MLGTSIGPLSSIILLTATMPHPTRLTCVNDITNVMTVALHSTVSTRKFRTIQFVTGTLAVPAIVEVSN